jgi:CxxC motif-containing protein
METICIVCPKSCRLNVSENGAVSGHSCPRGETYGREERLNPVRIVTSTVKISGAVHRRCPVKTGSAIPKRLIFGAIRLLDGVTLTAPVSEGIAVIEDICGTGIPWVTTRDM